MLVNGDFQTFLIKPEDFDQICLNTVLKTQNVEELSLDLIFHNNFWYLLKALVNKTPS